MGVDPEIILLSNKKGFRGGVLNKHARLRVYFVACEKDNKCGLNYIHPVTDTVKTLYDKMKPQIYFTLIILKKTLFSFGI